MDKIRIVFIVGTLVFGGTERQLVEILQRLDRKRFDCKVLSFECSGRLRKEIEKRDVPFTCLHFQATEGLFSLKSYIRIYRLIHGMVRFLSREQPHIVQSYLDWANIFGSIAAKIAGVPVIVTGRRATMMPEYAKYRHYTSFYCRWLLNLSNLWTTAVVANSKVVKEHCLERERFVSDKKFRVIYNGIDPDLYAYPPAGLVKKEAFHIPEHHQIVGMVASLHPRKGHRDLLEAAASVLESCPDTTFLIVGRNDGMQTPLEALADRLGIRSSVVFTGERDDIRELLSVFDVQVSSSYVEGLSNAILEGMALGNPIVATRVGGTPELIMDGESGVLVPSGDVAGLAGKIVTLLHHRDLRERLGRNARRRVETHFQMTQMVQRTEALYVELYNGKHIHT